MQTVLHILNEEFRLECAPNEQRRLEDLAAALEARLAGFFGDAEGFRRLVLTALSLLDEAQATNAALARARCEIERLNDLVAEAGVAAAEPVALDDRGRVNALRA